MRVCSLFCVSVDTLPMLVCAHALQVLVDGDGHDSTVINTCI